MPFEAKALTACQPWGSEPAKVMMNPRNLDNGFTRLCCVFVVPTQAAIPPQPGKRPFHHPPALQRDEPFLPRRAAHDHDPVGPVMHTQPTVEVMVVILVVRLHHLQPREILARHLAEHLLGRLGVVHVSGGHHHGQQQTQGIHGDMTFAATDLLAPIGADLLSAGGGLDRLTVNAADAGVGVAASDPANPQTKGNKETVPGAIAFPVLEVVVNGLPGWKVVRQGPPTATFTCEVKDGVDDLTPIGFARPTAGAWWWNPRFQDSPLGVGKV